MISSLLAVVLTASSPSIHRVALLIGANAAPPGRVALRFAHRDAQAMRDVLTRVGEVSPDDITLLLDAAPSAVLKSIDALLANRPAGEQTVVYFYYSGHADDSALYPNGERLAVEDVRAHLADVQATVRVGIVDACRGGSWTGAKGLTPSSQVDVALPERLRAEGTVLFASSSGFEEAHESEALQGSFFTHHLVAGLAGAADVSGDGVITATEAFQYAQRLTVRDSAGANLHPQHPSFELNLRGRQDFELTRLTQGSSLLAVAQTSGPLQVVELPSGLVLLELPEGPRQAQLAVAPGAYLVRRINATDVTNVREIKVVEGRTTSVDEASLTLVGRAAGAGKSAEAQVPVNQETVLPPHTMQLGLSAGVSYFPEPVTYDGFSGGVTTVSALAASPAFTLRFNWALNDWLELGLSPTSLGAAFRIGTPHHDEGVFSVGLSGFGFSNVESFITAPVVTAAYRHWFSNQSSVIAWVGGGARISGLGISPSMAGGGLFTVTFRELISFNLGATARGSPGSTSVMGTIGGGQIGLRALPLVQVHLTPVWTVDFNAEVTLFNDNAKLKAGQTYLVGFTATF